VLINRKVVQLDSKPMAQLTADKRRGKMLVQRSTPTPLFAVSTLRGGSLQLWDIDERRMVAYRKFEAREASSNPSSGASAAAAPRIQGSGGKKTDVSAALTSASLAAKGPPPKDELINSSVAISCVKFGSGALVASAAGAAAAGSAAGAQSSSSSGGGTLLALGFSNGFVKIVAVAEGDSTRVTGAVGSLEAFSGAGGKVSTVRSITSLVFSRDGHWLASSDAQGCVALYRFWHKDDLQEKALEWIYVGKYRAHYRPIISKLFTSGTWWPELDYFQASSTNLTNSAPRNACDELSRTLGQTSPPRTPVDAAQLTRTSAAAGGDALLASLHGKDNADALGWRRAMHP
jgi:WD40 repeat protein